MKLTQDILAYIEAHSQEALTLLTELAQIPAPSHQEDLRARFCLDWLHAQGAADTYMDAAKNVILPIGCTGSNSLAVFSAHSDVVFPDTVPLPLRIEDGKLFCPGVVDDTANVVALLMTAKYLIQHQLQPKNGGLLLAVNSCEEGLGNLKGARAIAAAFGSRIREWTSFDCGIHTVINEAVGSRRYRVEVRTEGGHSYSCFGNRNAIVSLSGLIQALYEIKVPPAGKTTYNVGTIEGGTSVNTIAQHAAMLYEFRSDRQESLEYMEKAFRDTLSRFRDTSLDITVTAVGDRPCAAGVDPSALDTLSRRTAEAVLRRYGHAASFGSASTDCNVPLSMGIPAVCIGCANGAGPHTREEYAFLDSLQPGLELAFDLILHHV